MNPSSVGWIGKYFHLIKDDVLPFSSFRDLYGELKKTGFVYGINIKIPRKIEADHKLTEDEAAKINVLDCIECGSCAFACPSKINLVHDIRLGKNRIVAQLKKEQSK